MYTLQNIHSYDNPVVAAVKSVAGWAQCLFLSFGKVQKVSHVAIRNPHNQEAVTRAMLED